MSFAGAHGRRGPLHGRKFRGRCSGCGVVGAELSVCIEKVVLLERKEYALTRCVEANGGSQPTATKNLNGDFIFLASERSLTFSLLLFSFSFCSRENNSRTKTT